MPDTPVNYLDDQGMGIHGNTEKAFCVKSCNNKNARFVSVVRNIPGHFFEIQTKGSPMFERVVRVNDGFSKANTARHSSPTPLVCVIMSMVANHAPSVAILAQFPSGSMSVNLAFQLSDKTLTTS